MIRKLAAFISIFIVCSLAFLPVSVLAVTTTIQPSSQDSFIRADMPDRADFGVANSLYVRGHVNACRTLVQFDLSSIPLGSTVSSATLRLRYVWWIDNDPVGRTYWAYQVTQSWTERVTWNEYDYFDGLTTPTNDWVTPGGDYTTTGGASATVPSSYGVWMDWTVTDIVKAWVEGGEPNYGFLIKDEDESGEVSYWAVFIPLDYGDAPPEWCPILEITYTLTPTPTPVGGIVIPVNKLDLLAPWIVLASVTSLAAVVFVKRRKRKQ